MTLIALFIVCLAVIAVQGEVPIVTRAEWNATHPNGPLDSMETPLPRAVIAHTAGGGCTDDVTCSQAMRNLQSYQMNRLKFSDIGYHYLIGGNGKVYEGRSPNQKGAFAAPNNDGSLGIAFIGNFEEQSPTQEALNVANKLLEHAVKQAQILEDYKLMGHSQVSATRSPGKVLYSIIQQWPNWSEQI
ncbi:peptidoglycan-recognition protein SD [Drosophila eugracilis]|uniref:peptidoglycan-recognition protein SD n=1 Tax=Drosophila eugracilis TaxID=29029 RepID=UPI0007E6BE12|nr:peptidoglycan-recognition protein SD [Drosophila eugracilis]